MFSEKEPSLIGNEMGGRSKMSAEDIDASLGARGITLADLKALPCNEGESLLLVGSFAEGLAGPDSDVDLLRCGELAINPAARLIETKNVLIELHRIRNMRVELRSVSWDTVGDFFERSEALIAAAKRRAGGKLPLLLNDTELLIVHRFISGVVITGHDALRKQDAGWMTECVYGACELRKGWDVLSCLEDISRNRNDLKIEARVWRVRAALEALASYIVTATRTSSNPDRKWAFHLLDRVQEFAAERREISDMYMAAGDALVGPGEGATGKTLSHIFRVVAAEMPLTRYLAGPLVPSLT